MDNNVAFHEFLGALSNMYTRSQSERNILLQIAVKHCPKDHADWLDVMRIKADDGES